MPQLDMVGDKIAAESLTAPVLISPVVNDKHAQQNGPINEIKVVSKKVAGKKRQFTCRKIRTTRCLNGKARILSKDSLSNPDSKKVKRNGRVTPIPVTNDIEFNGCSSVPSVASTEDSDLPDSVMSPTDEESCLYLTEEEFYGVTDNVSSGCDSENLATPSLPVTQDTSLPVTQDTSLPALRFSAFPNQPPCLNFCLHDEKVSILPWPIRRHLKWKLSTITPVVVRKTAVNSGFRIMKEPKDWIGSWGQHMKSVLFKLIPPHQKVNHFPGTFQIGRKDRMWRNMQKMVAKYGGEEFGFLPQTYILPYDLRLLRKAWSRNTQNVPWIVKPPASARGTGIQVIHQWSQLPRKRPLVVQSYLQNPYLINNTKFDIRLYVFVTSVNPLRIYMYENGLVRFASLAYSSEMDSLSDSYVHLTNYSINKNCEGYVANEDANVCQGHKWTLKSLWNYLEERGVNVENIKSSIKDIVIKTFLSAENVLLDMAKGNVANRYQCYELFGFDILLDANLKPWLLEVNISPSLHSSSSLDLSVKSPLIRDVFNMSRFHLPNSMNSVNKQQLSDYICQHYPNNVFSKRLDAEEGSQYCLNLEFYQHELSEKDIEKQKLYEQDNPTAQVNEGNWTVEENHSSDCPTKNTDPTDILNDLTESDIRHLIVTEDEISQANGFDRIFPSEGTGSYFKFMEKKRYYNVLLNEWQKKFGNDRHEAVEFLKKVSINLS